MADDLAAANVNRSYQLAASSIAIFTFLLFFLYPRFASGEVDALRFQATLDRDCPHDCPCDEAKPAHAARKLDQSAARKVIHLRAVHSTLF